MGLFDRLRPTGHSKAGDANEAVKQRALRLIDDGNVIEESGQLAEAMRHYEDAIALAPHLARAHMNRGNILLATDDAEGALTAYTTALTLEPDYAAANYNAGHAYLRLKRYEEARSAYEKAVQIKDDFVDAHVALGCVFEDLKQFDEAACCYRKALAIAPDYAQVHSNLGNALFELGQLDAAVASCRQALALQPEMPLTHVKLGQILKTLNQTDAAIACFHAALKLSPKNSDAHFSLGLTLKELGKMENAAASFRHAVDNDVTNPEKHIKLGDILNDLGQAENAIACYHQALKIKPDHAIAHSNLGNVMLAIGRFDDAIACYQRAIEIQPDFAAAHSNLGSTLLYIGSPEKALVTIRRALQLMPDLAAAQSNLLFIENSIAKLPAMQLLAEAKKYGEIASGKAHPFTKWSNDPDPDRCLRIGLVSADLRDHAVGHFVEGVLHSLSSLASKRLEIHAYTTFNCSDDMSQRIKSCCHGWHAVAHVSDEVVARRIREDKIDILIDLSGHTAHNRLTLFAWKAAPIQATWLGYLATTGVSAIDYLIADAWTLPATEEANFTEEILRLPESYLCFTPPKSDTPVGPLPALSNGHITFGSFNNLTKISDEVIALWSRVLISVPGSRLLLKAKQFTQPSVQQRIKDCFGSHGISSERLTLMGHVARGGYLAPYQQVDIALDPFPYPGITTSVESLWMGVPVLTLAGDSFLSRQGVGLMMNAGLPEWIASSPEEYISLAQKHASDTQRLSELRSTFRERMINSPIFDSVRFTKHFEDALRAVWRKWCAANKSKLTLPSWTITQTHPTFPTPSNYQLHTPSLSPQFVVAPLIGLPPKTNNLRKLHIGGKEAKPGWELLNAQRFEGVDHVGDVRDLSAFEDGSCEKVYASHVMEHVSQRDFLATLKGIHRILCDKGEFYFSVPDLDILCKIFLNPKLELAQRFHVMRMIFGGQVDDYDFHYIGLNAEFMMVYFQQAGFSSAKRVDSFGLFDDTSDLNLYDAPISLNMIATK